MNIQIQLDIEAPVEQVFVALLDPDIISACNLNVEEMKYLSAPVVSGTPYEQKWRVKGSKSRFMTVKGEVLKLEAPSLLVNQISLPGVIETTTHRLSSITHGTRLEVDIQYTVPNILYRWWMGLLQKKIKQKMTFFYQKVKAQVEHHLHCN